LPPVREEFDDSIFFFDPMFARIGQSHPFIRYTSSLVDKNIVELFCTPETGHLPEMWATVEHQLGDIAISWRSLLESGKPYVRNSSQGPSLVVHQQRLHLVVRGTEGYSLKALPKDLAVWSHLIALSLYHPVSEQNNYLRAIQWAVNCDGGSIPIGPKPEFRALSLLSKTWESLGESVDFAGNGRYIVEGTSSLWYSLSLQGNISSTAIEVRGYRNKKAAKEWNKGIKICIQIDDSMLTTLPLADKLAAYLLTLRNDQTSANEVSTLRMLHQTWFENQKNKSEKTWKQMFSNHPQGFQEDEETWEEDWDDEEFDYEEEPSTEIEELPEGEQYRFFEWLESVNHHDRYVLEVNRQVEDNVVHEDHSTSEEDYWKLEAQARGEAHCV
jgi:hypothetical protein